MTDHLAHARTTTDLEASDAARAWLAANRPAWDQQHGCDAAILAAFDAGRAAGAQSLGNAVALMAEAQQALADSAAAFAGADEGGMYRTCSDLAGRLEAMLLLDTTPRDRIAGLALSLVQDLQDEDEAGGGQVMGLTDLPAFVALRDALDGRPGAGAVPDAALEPVVDQADPDPQGLDALSAQMHGAAAQPPAVPVPSTGKPHVVRQALERVAADATLAGRHDFAASVAAMLDEAGDEDLALLGRLLK